MPVLGDPPPQWAHDFVHVEATAWKTGPNGTPTRTVRYYRWLAYACRSMRRDVARVRRQQRNRDREGWWDLGGEAG